MNLDPDKLSRYVEPKYSGSYEQCIWIASYICLTKETLEGRVTKEEEGVGGKRKQAKVESMRCMLAFKPLPFAPQPHAVSIQACMHRIMIHRVPLIKNMGGMGQQTVVLSAAA